MGAAVAERLASLTLTRSGAPRHHLQFFIYIFWNYNHTPMCMVILVFLLGISHEGVSPALTQHDRPWCCVTKGSRLLQGQRWIFFLFWSSGSKVAILWRMMNLPTVYNRHTICIYSCVKPCPTLWVLSNFNLLLIFPKKIILKTLKYIIRWFFLKQISMPILVTVF